MPLTQPCPIWQATSKPSPMPSPRTSAGQPAEKLKSLATSSPKSRSGSNRQVQAAEAAAAHAFTDPKSLPFDGSAASTGVAEEGRRRLKGAFLIAIDRIVPDPDQPRKKIDTTRLSELTASVSHVGIVVPITVRYIESENHYRIIAGERRFTAAKNAGLKEIPCWVKTPNAEHVLLEQIVENWQRSNLQPFEIADSLAQLRDMNGLTQTELAREVGKSKGEVSKLLSLLDLSPEVQKIARDDSTGRITKRHLYPILQLDPLLQERIVHAILDRDLTVKDTERMIARFQETNASPGPRGAPYTHRKFVTKHSSVLLTFRKKDVTDVDCVALLKEAVAQIKERAGDPADIA